MTANPEPIRPAPPTFDQFPLQTHEKLRYADTDRQGHVNNAVFATMLETGRVELFYNPVIGRSSTTLDQALFQDGTCVATATTVIVNVNAAGRGQPFSQAALAILSSYQGRRSI